ncbi:MAG TPA: glycosyltransferase [Blastocatellia bacterium]|nr:glycosyltransferase [Blastocatellia bacterium]
MGNSRPLVTFALFAYNHERFVAEAVRGALSQTYSPLEILISDDCSTDRTFDIVQAEVARYSGPHTVRLNRNNPNLGFGPSINRVMELAEGQLIVAASADDISLPDRVERLYQAYADSDSKAFSIFSNAIVIDATGNRKGWALANIPEETLTVSHMARRFGSALGATHVWDRRVFDLFGPIIERKSVAEDVIISFRSALLGQVRFIDAPLVLYRLHDGNTQFSEPDDTRPGEVETSLLKVGDMWIDACEQRLLDLKTMMALYPGRREELLGIETDLLACLREKKYDKELLLTPGGFRRIPIMLRAIFQGVRLRVIIRWILVFFFPAVYLVYQRKRTEEVQNRPV